MSKIITVETNKAIKNGAAISANGFGGKAPRATEMAGLKEGDLIVIPSDFQVLEQSFRKSENKAYYTYVEVQRKGATNGSVVTKAVPFYPSALYKRIRLAIKKVVKNDDGKDVESWVESGDWVVAKGSAVDSMQECETVDEFMANAAAKANPTDGTKAVYIRVKSLPVYDSIDFEGAHRRTSVGVFEWEEQA